MRMRRGLNIRGTQFLQHSTMSLLVTRTGSLDASSLGAGKTLVAVSSLAATCNIPACSLSEFCSVLAMRLGFCMHLASAHGGGQFLVLVASSSLMEGWRDQLSQHTAGVSPCSCVLPCCTCAFGPMCPEGVRIQLQQENGVLRDAASSVVRIRMSFHQLCFASLRFLRGLPNRPLARLHLARLHLARLHLARLHP